ncbi:hypothetical protein P171DRAFT_8919 [Karstenula rhodostoma CBS 690.94]|uniref:Uncharacterized protein n=1 Tax=Karstenula rhodostoma CBS 690.94 TaxID=1392251 RepID=A0A9P4PYL3_9PLEO|nr:hypothetical protein P171DRAFT_8919 [Karstenula rhodostoma CBS 690.94]
MTIMPRSKSKIKRYFNRAELKDRLEEESPGITDRIPSSSAFKFFTDRTPQKNVYVKVGETKVGVTKVGDTEVENTPRPVYVGYGDKTGNRMITFNVSALYPERIIHEKKELSRIGTKFYAPFNRLAPLRYEHPSSSFAESLQWATELRALMTFAFVWCRKRDEFFDFDKGEGIRVLVEVLERHPKATGAAAKRGCSNDAQKSAKANGRAASVELDTVTGVVAGSNTDAEVDADKAKDRDMDAENDTDAEDNIGVTVPMPATTVVQGSELNIGALASATSKKRTYEEFAAGQKD